MNWYNHRKYATAGSEALAIGTDTSVDGQDALLPWEVAGSVTETVSAYCREQMTPGAADQRDRFI